MLYEAIKPELLNLIAARDWNGLRVALEDAPGTEVADLILHLRKADRVLLFRALSRDTAADAFAHLDLQQQDLLLRDLSDEETRALLAELPPDDRTHLLEELPGQATQRLLNLLGAEDLKEARWLLGYPEDSVGRLMTPDYVAVRPDWTVGQALRHIRAHGRDSETLNRIFVVDEEWRLLDDIELRHVVMADLNASISDLMDSRVARISAFAHRNEAVNLIRRYAQFVVPVVDSGGVLVGIITVDDVLAVAEQETTEDFHRVGSVDPVRMSMRNAPVGLLYRARVGWLLGLVFVNILSGAGIAAFETTLEAAISLVFFLPLLIGSGGNAGAQAATLMIRALATGDVHAKDWFQMLVRELSVAFLLGCTMAVGVAAVAWYRAPEVLVVATSTMVLIVLWGSVLGMSLPFLLTRFRLDPATASAPLITSLADISGVLIYFSIATWYLGV
jgi:magnesium transporter